MKRKRIKGLEKGKFVGCSFCKEKTADHQIVGGERGGSTVCNDCYEKMKESDVIDNGDMSAGEEQAYHTYKVF